jgi:Family of unknown function (DUF6958)
MSEKIQLKHPEGKHAVRIEREKYDIMSKAILGCLKPGALTHKEMLAEVHSYFKKNKIKFSGSVEWHMESVKLDLEANKKVERVNEGSKLKFRLAGK